MNDDQWARPDLASRFVDGAYATAKGRVRTHVLHHQLLEHLPAPPATVLDVGGGAGHQSFPLAVAGYDVTVLDPSQAMLERARERLATLPDPARRRVRLVEADGRRAVEATGGGFDAVLCHGVLGYLDDPGPLIGQVCGCARDGGLVSIMTGNAAASAVRPALERRWDAALAAFDEDTATIKELGVSGRADTVANLRGAVRAHGVETIRWYGVWLFVDWLDFAGVPLDPDDAEQVAATAAVELEASRRDPYRGLSRAFHLVGRKAAAVAPDETASSGRASEDRVAELSPCPNSIHTAAACR